VRNVNLFEVYDIPCNLPLPFARTAQLAGSHGTGVAVAGVNGVAGVDGVAVTTMTVLADEPQATSIRLPLMRSETTATARRYFVFITSSTGLLRCYLSYTKHFRVMLGSTGRTQRNFLTASCSDEPRDSRAITRGMWFVRDVEEMPRRHWWYKAYNRITRKVWDILIVAGETEEYH
jgi:hypothetical protein